MKKYTLTLVLVLFFLATQIRAQKNTYFGVEAGLKFDKFHVADSRGLMDTKSSFETLAYGFSIERELNEHLSFETGLTFVTYWQTNKFKGSDEWTSNNLINTYHIPITIRSNISLFGGKLSFVPAASYVLGINGNYTSWGEGHETFAKSSGDKKIEVYDAWSSGKKKVFSLLGTEISLDLRLKNDMKIGLSAAYYAGLNKVLDILYVYQQTGEPQYEATTVSNGDYFSLSLGIKYPISRFWQ